MGRKERCVLGRGDADPHRQRYPGTCHVGVGAAHLLVRWVPLALQDLDQLKGLKAREVVWPERASAGKKNFLRLVLETHAEQYPVASGEASDTVGLPPPPAAGVPSATLAHSTVTVCALRTPPFFWQVPAAARLMTPWSSSCSASVKSGSR